MSDREHGYVERCDEKATKQYANLTRAAHQVAQKAGWTVLQVNFRYRIDVDERGKIGKSIDAKFMKVLLDEHDIILRSYQVQEHGDRDGLETMLGQRTDFGLGPV